MAHSGVRYLVLATGVLVLVLGLVAMLPAAASNAGRSAGRLFRVFVIFLDIQMLLGIVTAFVRPFVPAYIGHIVMMVGAVVVAHMFSARLRKAQPESPSPGLVVVAALLALGLIVGGILAIQRPLL
jgi:hypothetical protein